MAKFVVEQINRGKVERVETIDTTTPLKAAVECAGGPVTFRHNEDAWFKVTPAGGQRSFQFVKA